MDMMTPKKNDTENAGDAASFILSLAFSSDASSTEEEEL
jgi:hypothetical protein